MSFVIFLMRLHQSDSTTALLALAPDAKRDQLMLQLERPHGALLFHGLTHYEHEAQEHASIHMYSIVSLFTTHGCVLLTVHGVWCAAYLAHLDAIRVGVHQLVGGRPGGDTGGGALGVCGGEGGGSDGKGAEGHEHHQGEGKGNQPSHLLSPVPLSLFSTPLSHFIALGWEIPERPEEGLSDGWLVGQIEVWEPPLPSLPDTVETALGPRQKSDSLCICPGAVSG